MKTSLCVSAALLGVLFFFTGCETRSISNSDFNGGWRYSSPNYRGELTEVEVLGADTATHATDSDIAAELQNFKGAKLRHDSKILLIQSGADFPDAAMAEALARSFAVTPFSGKPESDRTIRHDLPGEPVASTPKLSYSKTLRLTAARGGYDKIVCYWGVLESERINKATKFVSWVPVVGYSLPDERENMRIRLKAAIIDVATGRWTLITPNPVESTGLSSIYSREDKDQSLVASLKDAAYKNLAKQLAESYVE